MMKLLARFLATGCYTGYSPVAPGTAGSLLALALYGFIPGFRGLVLLTASILIFFIGVWAASGVERIEKTKDPSIVVIDEVAGMWISLLFLPQNIHWAFWILAFFIFRFFDIVKPYPARKIETLPGGWGIMLDDVIAGLYSLAAIRVCIELYLRILA